MLCSAAAGLDWAMLPGCSSELLLDAAAGRQDLLACARADLQPAHRHRDGELAIGQHLRRALPCRDQSGREQRLDRDLGVRPEQLEVAEAHDLVLLTERVREPALRDAARHRHLAALEVRLAAARTVMARARLRSLVTLARRLARAGAGAAPEALALPARARRRRQVVQAQRFGARVLSHVSHSSTGVTS